MAKFDVKVQLAGQDGNAFMILGRVAGALRKAGATQEEIAQYNNEAMDGDYDNLIRVTAEWVEVY